LGFSWQLLQAGKKKTVGSGPLGNVPALDARGKGKGRGDSVKLRLRCVSFCGNVDAIMTSGERAQGDDFRLGVKPALRGTDLKRRQRWAP